MLDRLESRHYWPDPRAARTTTAIGRRVVGQGQWRSGFPASRCHLPRSRRLRRWRHSSLNWSNPSPSRSCRSCGTSLPVFASEKSGRRRGNSSGRKMLARMSARSRCRRSTRQLTFKSPTTGVCVASWTFPKNAGSASRTAKPRGDPSLVVGWAGWNHLQQGHGHRRLLRRPQDVKAGRQASDATARRYSINCCHGFTNGIPKSIPNTTKRQARRSRRCWNPKPTNSA